MFLLEPALLLEPASVVLLPLLAVFAGGVAFFFVTGFFACSVAAVDELCARTPTPPPANGVTIASKEATAIAPKNLCRMPITASLFFQTTHPL